MRIAFVIIALMMTGCGVKTRGNLLTGSISINDNIGNKTTREVIDTTSDVTNGIDRVKTIGKIIDIYTK